MSKTYTLQATLNTGHLIHSDTLEPSWTNFLTWNGAAENLGRAGYDAGYWYYATNMMFDQTTLASLRSKVSNGITITGLTLTVNCTKAMTGETLIGYKLNSTASGASSSKAWARCHNDGTSGADADSVAYFIPAQTLSTGTQTFNLKRTTPYSGIPQYGLVAGPQTNVSGNWRFDSATLYVTTNELTVNYYRGTNGTGDNVTDVIASGGNLRGAIFTRTGYTQTGWATSDGGAKVYNLSAQYTGTADLTLYPYWTAVTYTVTYAPGSYSSGSNYTDTKTYGVALTLRGAGYTRAHYSHDGWSVNSDGSTKDYNLSGSYTNNAAITLYPYWKADTYTVSYNANGGTGAPAAQTQNYPWHTQIPSTTPTRSGYIFQGWATSSTGAVAYQPGDWYTSLVSVILYAIWQAATSTVSTTNGTLGTAQTITITRSDSSYTHNLSYTYGSLTGSIATGVGTSYSWTPSTSLASAFPNATSGVCTITCETKSGTTTLGTTTTTCTLNIPESIKPSGVSLTAAHYAANTAISGWGVFTRGYSQADLTVAYTLNGGATLSSITFNGPGISFTGTATSKRTSVLTSAGTNTWTVTVTDSRGRATSATVSKTVYDYAPPLISSIEVSRCDSNGTANNGSGTYMKFKPHFSVSSVNGNNGLATSNGAVFKWRVAGGSWGTAFAVTNDTWTSVLGAGLIDITKSYEGQLTVTDKVGNSTTFTVTLPSASGIWYGKGNDRLGLGGVPEGAGLWCDWDATFKGVVDVVPRRCDAVLNSDGWYRILRYDAPNSDAASGVLPFEIEFFIGRVTNTTTNELHKVTLFAAQNYFRFNNEFSQSQTFSIDKIRAMLSGSTLYVDVHYSGNSANVVYVDFSVHCWWEYKGLFAPVAFESVYPSPYGETPLTTYEFTANGIRTVTLTSAHGSVTINGQKVARSGQVVSLWVDFTVSSSISGYDYLIYAPTFATGANALVYDAGNTVQTNVRLYADEGNYGLRCYGEFPSGRYVAFITYITTDF